jgi:hypothetical protein
VRALKALDPPLPHADPASSTPGPHSKQCPVVIEPSCVANDPVVPGAIPSAVATPAPNPVIPLNGAAVAVIVPEPVAPNVAPEPTSIAAVVLVPPPRALKAVPAPVQLPAVHAPPLPMTQSPLTAASAENGDVPLPRGNAPAVNVVRCEGPPTSIVPVPVSGEGDTTMLVSPAVTLTEPPPVAFSVDPDIDKFVPSAITEPTPLAFHPARLLAVGPIAPNGEAPAPIGIALAVNVVRSEGPVSESVPAVVIVPPDSGAVVPMLVTVPLPPPPPPQALVAAM